jgi:hypothetical protein
LLTILQKKTFFYNVSLFRLVGLDLDDMLNIGNVHIVNFLGLFAINVGPGKYREFAKTFENTHGRKPNKSDVLNKNRAIFTLFFKQRVEDVIRICRQKARNIKGIPTEEYFYYYGPNKPPQILRELIKNYEKLGFKKLDTAIYKSIKKKMNIRMGMRNRFGNSILGNNFTFDNNYYVAVPVGRKYLSDHDFDGANISPYDNMHNMNPEDIYFVSEDEEVWKNVKEEFNSKSNILKANIVRRFISENQSNPRFKEEINTAKRLLKELH